MLEFDRVGAVGDELHREVVDLPRHAGRGRVRAKLRRVAPRPLVAEHDVIRGERRAVVELDAGPQLEAPRGRIDLRPRLRQRRDDAQVLVALDEELVDQRIDVVGQAFVLRMRIGGLHVAAAGPAQRDGIGSQRRRGRGRRWPRRGRDGSRHGTGNAWNTSGSMDSGARRIPCARVPSIILKSRAGRGRIRAARSLTCAVRGRPAAPRRHSQSRWPRSRTLADLSATPRARDGVRCGAPRAPHRARPRAPIAGGRVAGDRRRRRPVGGQARGARRRQARGALSGRPARWRNAPRTSNARSAPIRW